MGREARGRACLVAELRKYFLSWMPYPGWMEEMSLEPAWFCLACGGWCQLLT